MRRRYWLGAALLLASGALAAYWLRPDDGPLLRTVTVGHMPGMVAVDARTDRAFVTNSADNSVSVLDAGTGKVLRGVALLGEPDVVDADVPAGRVFVLDDPDNTVSMLDATSGALLRTLQLTTADLAIDERTGRAFVSGLPLYGPGTVAMLDGRSGAVLHTAVVGGKDAWGLAVDAGTHRAFVANFYDNDVAVVDTRRGRVLRTVAAGRSPVAVAVDEPAGHVFVTNNGAGTVTMLDARSGAVLRTIKVGPEPGRVVVDEQTERVFIVHGRGGNRFFFPTDGPGGTTMLDARSGTVLRQVAAGGSPLDDVGFVDAVNLAVDRRRGRVFVIDQSLTATQNTAEAGSVSVLDAHSGRVLSKIEVGRHPVGLAVDEATARLFVVNTNSGCIPGSDAWGWLPGGIRRALPASFARTSRPRCGVPGTVTVVDTSRL